MGEPLNLRNCSLQDLQHFADSLQESHNVEHRFFSEFITKRDELLASGGTLDELSLLRVSSTKVRKFLNDCLSRNLVSFGVESEMQDSLQDSGLDRGYVYSSLASLDAKMDMLSKRLDAETESRKKEIRKLDLDRKRDSENLDRKFELLMKKFDKYLERDNKKVQDTTAKDESNVVADQVTPASTDDDDDEGAVGDDINVFDVITGGQGQRMADVYKSRPGPDFHSRARQVIPVRESSVNPNVISRQTTFISSSPQQAAGLQTGSEQYRSSLGVNHSTPGIMGKTGSVTGNVQSQYPNMVPDSFPSQSYSVNPLTRNSQNFNNYPPPSHDQNFNNNVNNNQNFSNHGNNFPPPSDYTPISGFNNTRSGNVQYAKPPARKLPTFDGRTDWLTFITKFENVKKQYGWHTEAADRFSDCLTGRAAEHFANLPFHMQNDYEQVKRRFTSFYGSHDTFDTLRDELRASKQKVDQDIAEFAQEVQILAHKAYPFSEAEANYNGVQAFIGGCNFRDIAFEVAKIQPSTIDEALRQFVFLSSKFKSIFGSKCKVRYIDTSDCDAEIRVAQPEKSDISNSNSELFKRLGNVEQTLVSYQTTLDKIVQNMTCNKPPSPFRTVRFDDNQNSGNLNRSDYQRNPGNSPRAGFKGSPGNSPRNPYSPQRSNSPSNSSNYRSGGNDNRQNYSNSRSNNRPTSPTTSNRCCFHCGADNHWKADCPKLEKRNQSPMRGSPR